MYIDGNNEKQQPIMIHRALLGSLERFFGILVENYAGAPCVCTRILRAPYVCGCVDCCGRKCRCVGCPFPEHLM